MKLENKQLTFLTAVLLLSGTIILSSFIDPGPKKAPKKTVNISGTRFFFPLIEKWGEEFEKENPNIDIVVKFGIADKDIESKQADYILENVELMQDSYNNFFYT